MTEKSVRKYHRQNVSLNRKKTGNGNNIEETHKMTISNIEETHKFNKNKFFSKKFRKPLPFFEKRGRILYDSMSKECDGMFRACEVKKERMKKIWH